MRRRAFLGATGVATIAGYPSITGTVVSQDGYQTIRVPDDHETIQDAVDAAEEGALVLVEEGAYEEAIEIATPGITLRGLDRNAVVLHGGFELQNGVLVEANGVAVENLTVRHFVNNAVYWSGVEGFRGSFLTAYNNGYYGIYAYRSRDGRFEYSYASGHPDAGFYLGRNRPYNAVVADVVAEYNGLGYSGTSTGGNLTIRDSIFRHNMAGIVPNTLDEVDPPQRGSRIVDNVVVDNSNENAPAEAYTYSMFGTGIALWGANDNRVENNVVEGHPNFGIAAYANVVEPSGNEIRANVVRESGRADLALAAPTGANNQFVDNRFATSRPGDLEDDASEGDGRVSEVYDSQKRRVEDEEYPSGDWRDQPEPGDHPTMREPEAPPRPASMDASWGPE